MRKAIGLQENHIKFQKFVKLEKQRICKHALLSRCKMLKWCGKKAQEDTTMNAKLKELNVEYLFQAILKLENVEECYKFFEDLCTVPELKALSQRLLVAKMLDDHRVYSDIVAETGASTATISRVNRSLNYGSDGYRIVFERLEKE